MFDVNCLLKNFLVKMPIVGIENSAYLILGAELFQDSNPC